MPPASALEDANDDGAPELRWYAKPPGLGVCSFAAMWCRLTFELTGPRPQGATMTDTTAGVGPVEKARRHGRFTAPAEWARQFRTELKRVMGQCIVFRAEHLFDADRIEYWAASEHFRHVPLGEVAPEYRWHFTDDGGLRCEEVKA